LFQKKARLILSITKKPLKLKVVFRENLLRSANDGMQLEHGSGKTSPMLELQIFRIKKALSEDWAGTQREHYMP
jgi:hypothetical protein